MTYQVLYRTYRPAKFSEVVGQDYIIKTLQNAIRLNKIAHAYLFAGPRGTGKTTIAKLFAKAINCTDYNGEACDQCESCLSFKEGNHPDILELDAASNNGVDDVRNIVEQIPYAPIMGKYKVYIIDEAHMLTSNAFNALLKTLEEPPAHVVFILATTDPQKIIPTVLSRCQRYNFSKISEYGMQNKMKEILQKESIPFEETALKEIADLADGGMRDALSILEQVLSYNSQGIYLEDVQKIFGLSSLATKLELLEELYNGNISPAIKTLREMYQNGNDLKRLSADLLEIVKEVLIYSDNGNEELLSTIKAIDAQSILKMAKPTKLLNDISILEDLTSNRYNQNLLNYIELAFIKMAAKKNETVTIKEETKVVQKELPKETTPEIKTEPQTLNTEVIENKDSDSINADLDYLAGLLLTADKASKINDAVIYNKLELYKFDPDKRKFYELLNKTEHFASGKDMIVVFGDDSTIANLNTKFINDGLYEFLVNEYGIDKVMFGVTYQNKDELIRIYKEKAKNRNSEIPTVEKPQLAKILSTEDKLKELFDNVRIEE